jgi:integrase/recombinase XerD
MQFSKALEGFYLARSAEGISPRTVEIYQWSLEPLCKALQDPEVEAITTHQLQTYLAKLIKEGRLSVLSVQMVHRCIRAFWSWAEVDLNLPSRPDKSIKKPAGKGEEIQPFTLSEIEKMVKACDYTKVVDTQGDRRLFQMKRPEVRRDKAILLLMLDTGVRAGELCRLDVGDVEMDNGEVSIRPFRSSHKSRPRTVYLGKAARRALWLYLAERGKPGPEEPLFLSGDKQEVLRYNPNALGKLIRGLGERAGVKNAHPHRLRHTMAIQYLRNRGDPFTLKKLLGLASWAIVQVYIQLAETDLQTVHKTASPVDGWRL